MVGAREAELEVALARIRLGCGNERLTRLARRPRPLERDHLLIFQMPEKIQGDL